MSIFSENIKALRKKKGFSQAEVAEHLGMTKQGYSLYELGKREPDFDTLKAIADFFGTDTDFLLSEYDTVSISDSKLKFALFGDTEIDDDVLDDVKRLAMEHLKYRQKQKEQENN
ncbi:MAG: helix-turn-helix transcriptional regulator [Ruminococcaceae bacterium]|nr:helix-turn-helix transcriptional regulator [Oscillospiraceae bacterium]